MSLATSQQASIGMESTRMVFIFFWRYEVYPLTICFKGTNEMDGASGVTQCPVAPGQSFTYDFTVSTSHVRNFQDTDNL